MSGTAGRTPAPTAPVAPVPRPGAVTPAGRAWPDAQLGPAQEWPPALRTAVQLALDAAVPMAVACGPEHRLVYNDAFAALIGTYHPAAFGRPGAEGLAREWRRPGVGDAVERVYRTGEPGQEPEQVFPVDGADPTRPEYRVFARGHSPVRDERGAVLGVLIVAVETAQMTQRLRNLGELTTALSGSLTLNDVARVALRYALASFDAEQVAFGVDDGPAWRLVRRVRSDQLDEVDERLPPLWRHHPEDSPAPLVDTARSGQPVFVADGRPLQATAADRHDQLVRALAALPLRTPSLRGALTVGYRDPHGWAPAERALLAAAAELVAQAAERARRFENQHGTAQLLQRSMLPDNLPDLPQLRLAARYEPGVDGNAAGGDFYDAFRLSEGELAVVLGDVAGHDVQAAAVMGQVRAALRALALADPEPAGVLRGLDRLVSSLGAEASSDELFVTVVYGVIEPNDGRMRIASAGHPAPLLRRVGPDGVAAAEYLDIPPGAPLGLGGRRTATAVRLAAGDTLLLYSDGVIERRQQGLGAGFDRLAAVVGGAPAGDPRTLCSVASTAVPGATEDDVAVLAVELAVSPSRSAVMEVPAEPTAPGRVRHWMTDQLAEWRVPEQVIGAAVLCTSELTTNALLHAGTAARVEIDLTPERLLVSVADSGTRGRVVRAHTDTLSSRGRGLGLIEQLSDAWGTDPTVRGSTVWFEMLIPPAGSRIGGADPG
ncbi:ATP-binding SpoIIE family protein phosphatase [Plantactinospora sp. KBS50]|uniref:ATP-binding SpoIIE family protein phosphatase n=1 Tax=Plantactinospora sp. KBS50 TaxID=2024580 RepID=UPI000BAAA2D6|nr:ATP-binding SpoIIE family protein phosphatase [Plantactinospora sp. KBS50]ASW54566.1 histidine kinase [Plantactinospora sp. KBS50]